MRTDKPPWGFRPWPKAAAQLEYAEKLGFKKSEIVNQILERHLKGYLESVIKDRKQELRTILEAQLP